MYAITNIRDRYVLKDIFVHTPGNVNEICTTLIRYVYARPFVSLQTSNSVPMPYNIFKIYARQRRYSDKEIEDVKIWVSRESWDTLQALSLVNSGKLLKKTRGPIFGGIHGMS